MMTLANLKHEPAKKNAGIKLAKFLARTQRLDNLKKMTICTVAKVR